MAMAMPATPVASCVSETAPRVREDAISSVGLDPDLVLLPVGTHRGDAAGVVDPVGEDALDDRFGAAAEVGGDGAHVGALAPRGVRRLDGEPHGLLADDVVPELGD